MKKLLEKRSKLLKEAETLTGSNEIETRELSEEDAKKVEEIIAQVKEIDKKLEMLKEVKSLKNTEDAPKDEAENTEMRSRLLSGDEVEVRNLNRRSMTKANVKGETTVNGELVKDRPKTLGLKDFARIEYFNGTNIIPVQKSKMGKLVKAAELSEITKKDILVEQVDLRPEKYALLTVVSEELMNDASYDVEALIREEGLQAIDETVEGMIADTLNKAADVVEVAPKAEGAIALDDVNGLYFGLDERYRKNAVFIVNSDHLRGLFSLTDLNKQPLLVRDLTQDFIYKIYNRPVILCDDIENMMFVDMEKAVVAGIGKNAQVKRSDDAFFTTAGIAFRTTVPLDVKPCITKAIAKLGTAAA